MPSQNNLLPLHLREEGMKDQKKPKTKQNKTWDMQTAHPRKRKEEEVK